VARVFRPHSCSMIASRIRLPYLEGSGSFLVPGRPVWEKRGAGRAGCSISTGLFREVHAGACTSSEEESRA
jgi:hypothetical protein